MLQSIPTVVEKQPEQNQPFNSPFSCSMLLFKNNVFGIRLISIEKTF
jgi:hypothetical protein